MKDDPDEIICIPQAKEALEFTGERLTSGTESDITFEHWHRYMFAERFCRGKDVLDLASGEGYGSALLALKARSVYGVDVDVKSVEHAKSSFIRNNLIYSVGSATQIAFASESFDVVVSMETLEHLSEQELFLQEIKRVLRKDGVLIISSPNAATYSGPFQPINPHHEKELLSKDLFKLIASQFKNQAFLGQSSINGNAILPLKSVPAGTVFYNQNIANRLGVYIDTYRSIYFLVIASDESLPPIPASLFNAAHYHASRSLEADHLASQRENAAKTISDLQDTIALKQVELQEEKDRLRRIEGIFEITCAETDRRLATAELPSRQIFMPQADAASGGLYEMGETKEANHHLNQAGHLIGLGNVYAASWEYRRAINHGKVFKTEGLSEAWIKLSDECHVEALNLFKILADDSLIDRDVFITVAILERSHGDTYVGHPYLMKALDAWPDDAALNHQIGHSYLMQSNRREAALYYENALRIEPNNTDYLFSLFTVLNDLGEYERVLQFYGNARKVVDPHLRQWAVGYVGHARVAGQIDRNSLRSSLIRQEESENWSSTEQVWARIREAVLQRQPFSLVRLGDGEGRFLFRDDPDPKYKEIDRCEFSDTAFLNWFGRDSCQFSLYERLEIREKVACAIGSADVLGLPMLSRVDVDFQNLGYLWFLQSYLDREVCFKSRITANCFVNVEIHKEDSFYLRLLDGCVGVKVISCHKDLGVRLAIHLGVPVEEIVVAGEQGQPNLPASARVGSHYPDQYLDVLKAIESCLPGTVWLVAAGLLGKIYCSEVKRHGGIAIDIGSLADAWMGHNTRAGHYENREQYLLAGEDVTSSRNQHGSSPLTYPPINGKE